MEVGRQSKEKERESQKRQEVLNTRKNTFKIKQEIVHKWHHDSSPTRSVSYDLIL